MPSMSFIIIFAMFHPAGPDKQAQSHLLFPLQLDFVFFLQMFSLPFPKRYISRIPED